MLNEIIDVVSGAFENLSGCDPEAPSSDPCKKDARKKASWMVYLLVGVIVLMLIGTLVKYAKPLFGKGGA